MERWRSGNEAGGIHVTPIIDVLLVLLIIFLVIAPERAKGLAGGGSSERGGGCVEVSGGRDGVIRAKQEVMGMEGRRGG